MSPTPAAWTTAAAATLRQEQKMTDHPPRPSRNEAAERLRDMLTRWSPPAVSRSLTATLDEALATERALDTSAVTDEELVDIIEQAIFETDTGLAAALLATERIQARLAERSEGEDER